MKNNFLKVEILNRAETIKGSQPEDLEGNPPELLD